MPTNLSYTTLTDVINEPHTWLCKQMGLAKLTTRQMGEGKAAHRIIQNHVAGIEYDERLKNLKCKFDIVERHDQDEATHFVVKVNDDYNIHGYLDGIDTITPSFLEIKTSSSPWSMGQFARLIQWRIYALSNLKYSVAWFITCTRDLKRVAVYKQAVTDADRVAALAWIQKGIDIIDSGDFTYNGIGHSRACPYVHCPICGDMFD